MSQGVCIYEPLMSKEVFQDLIRQVKITDIDFTLGCVKNKAKSQSNNEISSSSLAGESEP